MIIVDGLDHIISSIVANYMQSGIMDQLMKIITWLGGNIFWLVIGIILVCIKKYRKYGIMIFAMIFITWFVGDMLLSSIVQRARPYEEFNVSLLVPKPSGCSFPAAHAMHIFAMAAILGRVNKLYKVPAYTVASLVGFSRIYLMVHYFSDVLFGAVFGILCGEILYFLGTKVILSFSEMFGNFTDGFKKTESDF